MLMSIRSEGDFTTNASVVDQISKGQDVCQVLLSPTTLFAFVLRKLLLGDIVFYCITIIDIKLRKLLPKAKGVSPVVRNT